MSVSSKIIIGDETVDLSQPCLVVLALRKAELKVATGNQHVTVRFDEDEVSYGKANLAALGNLIRHYDGLCRLEGGKKQRRSAISVRWA